VFAVRFVLCFDRGVSEPPAAPLPSYAELAAENAQLRALLVQALGEIEQLKARLGMTSKNSSKQLATTSAPPS
jgi:hypothetical protein